MNGTTSNNKEPVSATHETPQKASPPLANTAEQFSVEEESSSGRKKVHLQKGYSLMDWIRFTKTSTDLAGNGGVPFLVTPDELARHNTESDCWLAIQDKVYNVTPYMKFHPGGVDELLRGAGLNATRLFNDVHPWVNYQSMLEKCLVGQLVRPASSISSSLAGSESSGSSSLSNQSSLTVPALSKHNSRWK